MNKRSVFLIAIISRATTSPPTSTPRSCTSTGTTTTPGSQVQTEFNERGDVLSVISVYSL